MRSAVVSAETLRIPAPTDPEIITRPLSRVPDAHVPKMSRFHHARPPKKKPVPGTPVDEGAGNRS